MSDFSQTAHDLGNQASDEAQSLASQVKDKASSVMQSVRDASGSAARAVSDTYSNVRDSASEYIDAGKQKMVEMGQSMQSQIQSHPLNAVLIAAGCGFLLGLLLTRR